MTVIRDNFGVIATSFWRIVTFCSTWVLDWWRARVTRARASGREQAFYICLSASTNLIERVARKGGITSDWFYYETTFFFRFTRIEYDVRIVSQLDAFRIVRSPMRMKEGFIRVLFTCIVCVLTRLWCMSASIERDGRWKEDPFVTKSIIVISSGKERERKS